MIKSAGIYKFTSGKTIVHSERIVIDCGSYASEPYFIEIHPTYKRLAENLIKALNHSIYDAPQPLDWKAIQKHHLDAIGVKSMKDLHEGSLYVSVFIKDGNYNISSTVNKGSKLGFHYSKDKIVIPEKSSLEKIANALKEAFDKNE